MSETIVGRFASRRDADLAIERLVQEHGIERTDIFAEAGSESNSVGERASGADVESGHPGVAADGRPALEGPIKVSIDLNDGDRDTVRAAIEEAGGELLAD